MSKSIKTKTVLTMTDMTEPTELQAFKRPKDDYKVTVKMSLCICVVLSRDELKVRQNLLDSDYGIYMVRLLVVTVNWHKSQPSRTCTAERWRERPSLLLVFVTFYFLNPSRVTFNLSLEPEQLASRHIYFKHMLTVKVKEISDFWIFRWRG